jgi:hypothetical protein
MDLTNLNFLHLADRLFDFKPPIQENVEYYLSLFGRYYKHKQLRKNLEDLWDLYSQDLTITPVAFREKYKAKIMANMISHPFLDLPSITSDFKEIKPQFEDDQTYISVDLKSANWNVMSYYGVTSITKSSIPSWSDTLVYGMGIPDVIARSKSFRQVILGQNELNPKKQIQYMRLAMNELFNQLNSFNIVGLTNDEIIIKTDDFKSFDKISDFKSALPISINYFKYEVKHSGQLKSNVMTYYDIDGNELYKRLYGYNGRFFVPLLKTFIFDEPLTHEDTLYDLIEDGNRYRTEFKNLI